MKSKLCASAAALVFLLMLAGMMPSFAEKSAQLMQVRVGYFNLALVKASYPEAAGSESLRTQAESQLRRDVEEGNRRLQKAQDEKKPKEEIEKMARELQAEINAKQQALIQLVQTQAALATQNIAQAVASVSKDKSLDLVVDGAGIFAGGEKIVSNGEDITEAIVKKLQPQAIKPGGGATTSGAGSTKPAASK